MSIPSDNMQDAAREFVGSLGFVYPIVFESGDDYMPYYCGGTCFAVTIEDALFLVTAQHCLKNREGDPCIIGPEGHFFPIKETFPLACDDDDNDWADLVCISTYERAHWPALEGKNTVNLDELIKRKITADRGSFLAVKGYPASHTEIDPPKTLRKPSFHLGVYGGPTGDAHCHFFNVLSPPIDDPDGLSGSPVVMIDRLPSPSVSPTLLGVIIKGGENVQFLRFVGVDIVIRLLLQLKKR